MHSLCCHLLFTCGGIQRKHENNQEENNAASEKSYSIDIVLISLHINMPNVTLFSF